MKRKGISLITLVITIVIIIILAGAVILNLADNNPVESAKKGAVMQDIDTFRTELILKTTTANNLFNTAKINAVTKDDILKYIPSMKDVKIGKALYTDILVISEGTLAVDGSKVNECITNGKLTKEQYDWIVEALGNNVFNAQTYSIKYYANDGTEEYTESSKIHNVKYSILSNSKDRVGYGFKNWNTEKDGTGTTYNVGDEYIDNTGLTLYAQWEAGTYTITYYKNDGTEEAKIATKTQDTAYEIIDQSFTREGYTFIGFNTSKDGTGTDYTVGASYTENAKLDLYAKWTPVTYTVTYNANGGQNAPANQTKTHDVSLTLSSSIPTRTGYTFEGWNTNASGTGTNYAKGTSYTLNANLDLYAKWKQDIVVASASEVKLNASTYYGAYVNYTPKNGYDGKWRVFLADNSTIYLISENCVENKYLTSTGLSTSGTTGIFSDVSRDDLITRLTTSSYYTEFKDLAGKANSVVGAPTLEQFVQSYNAVNTPTILIHSYSASETYGGYTAKAAGYGLKLSNETNYNFYTTIPADANKRDLYVNGFATWLATTSVYDATRVCDVGYNGRVERFLSYSYI